MAVSGLGSVSQILIHSLLSWMMKTQRCVSALNNIDLSIEHRLRFSLVLRKPNLILFQFWFDLHLIQQLEQTRFASLVLEKKRIIYHYHIQIDKPFLLLFCPDATCISHTLTTHLISSTKFVGFDRVRIEPSSGFRSFYLVKCLKKLEDMNEFTRLPPPVKPTEQPASRPPRFVQSVLDQEKKQR